MALPSPQVIKNKDGTETIVAYFIRDDGKKVKTTRRIRKTVVRQVVNPRVAERRGWIKFGNEKGKPVGPQTDTTSVAENIVFRPAVNWKATAEEDRTEAEKKKNALKDAKIKCRICQRDHWTRNCPFKDTMAPKGEGGLGATDLDDLDGAGGGGGGGPGGSGAGGGATGTSYVPPHMRKGAASTGDRMGGKYERDDLATLRVTNVSEVAEEQDLRDMFARFGHVTRVFLAKDRETNRAKGFAFVSFADRTDAARACDKMDGCRLPHTSILTVAQRVLTIRRWIWTSYSASRVCEKSYMILCPNMQFIMGGIGMRPWILSNE